MKKICIISSNLLTVGGIERVNQTITNLLAENTNYEITLISVFGDGFDSEPKLVISDRVKAKCLMTEPTHLHRNAFKIIKIIETEILSNQYDIVLSSDLRSYFVFIKLMNKSRFKLVLWEHSNSFVVQSFLYRLARKIYMKVNDKLVVLTDKDNQSYIERFEEQGKSIRIYNPYTFVQEMNYNYKSKKILTIARLSQEKGLDYIVEIGKIIFKRFSDWSWDIYGQGDQYQFLNELIIKNKLENHIFLKGVSYDVKNIYPSYSIFGFTSKSEGLGLVLLEAKMCKLPIVSFDINCGPSEVISESLNGYLIPPFNVEVYAEKIMMLMESEELRQVFSEKSRIDFDKFTSSKIKKEWEDLIDSL